MNKQIIVVIFSIFIPCVIEAKHAGILPYQKHKGKIYFLLGREARGRHKHTWADFGGDEKPEDRGNVKNIAIREFSEETHGVFGKTFKSNIANPYEADKKYLEHRISQEILNPGPRTYYSMYLAEVDYLDPQKFAKGPIQDDEKDLYDWVPAEDFINTLAKETDNHNAYYRDKKIRPPFAEYFMEQTTRNKIKSILGISTTEEEGWAPSPSRGAEHYEPPYYGEEEEEGHWVEQYLPKRPRQQPYPAQPIHQAPVYESPYEGYEYNEEKEEPRWVPDQPSRLKELERNLRKLLPKLHKLKDALPRRRR